MSWSTTSYANNTANRKDLFTWSVNEGRNTDVLKIQIVLFVCSSTELLLVRSLGLVWITFNYSFGKKATMQCLRGHRGLVLTKKEQHTPVDISDMLHTLRSGNKKSTTNVPGDWFCSTKFPNLPSWTCFHTTFWQKPTCLFLVPHYIWKSSKIGTRNTTTNFRNFGSHIVNKVLHTCMYI